MATRTVSGMTGGSNNHAEPIDTVNQVATDFISPGVVGAITQGFSSTAGTGAYAVSQSGPSMNLSVAGGTAYVSGTPTGGSSNTFRVKQDVADAVTIASNTSGSTAYDWIYIKLDPAKLANPNVAGTDPATLVVSRSSSNSTDNGTPPTYGLNLAIITVANGASSITNSNISDKRPAASGLLASSSTTLAETTQNFVKSGFIIATSASLSSTIAPAGGQSVSVAYVDGTRITLPNTSITVTASKDTYVDLLNSGAIVQVAVANGATTGMPISTNTDGTNGLRIAKIVSSGSAITSVTQSNYDPLNNKIYPTGPIGKAQLDGPHYNALYFSASNGSVFGATEVQIPFSAASSHANGITSQNLGTSTAQLTIARDGIYNISFVGRCIDVQATGFISWIFVIEGGDATKTYNTRAVGQSIPVGQISEQQTTLWLPSGTFVFGHWFNSGGSTRFGYDNTLTAPSELGLIAATSLSVTEIR